MKKIKIIGTLGLTALLGINNIAHAEAPGGPDCGWGNMIFQGDNGVVSHTAAYVTNGLSSFNAFFGIVFGTNGCDTRGVLTYGGEPMLGLNHMLDELAQDIAQGQGEALSALNVALKIQPEDRAYFNETLHHRFNDIFKHENIEAAEVYQNIQALMREDERLKPYLG